MRLQYEIVAPVRSGQIRTALRSVEREMQASNRRMAADAQKTARSATVGPRSGVSAAMRLDKQRSRALYSQFTAQQRAEVAAARNVARAKESLDRQRHRALLGQFREEERAAKRVASARQTTARKMAGGFARSTTGAVKTVGGILGASASVAGGLAIANALAERSEATRMASQLANQAGNPALKGQLLAESGKVRGFDSSETLGAMSGFVGKTGDLDAARQVIPQLGDLALATGTDFAELGEAAGHAFNVIRDTVSDPVEQIKQLRDVMSTLAQQGAMGALEIKDMATELAGLGASTRLFQGGAPDLLKTMGAIAQASLARGGTSSGAEATTAVSRLSKDIIQNRDEFSALGINVFADKKKTKLKDPMSIIGDVLEKTGGDLSKVSGLFNIESMKAFQGFAPIFNEAEAKKKGSGREAVMAEFNKFFKATKSTAEIEAGAKSRLSDPDMKFKEATKQFNEAIGTKLLPVVTRAVERFTELMPQITRIVDGGAKLAEWFIQNPFAGIGAVIAASVAKDIAVAGIGGVIKQMILSSMGGPGGGPGGLKGGLAMTGAALGIAGTIDQGSDFLNENGGWAGAGAFLTGGFKGLDEEMNRQARVRKSLEAPVPSVSTPTGPGSVSKDPMLQVGIPAPEVAKQLQGLGAAAAKAKKDLEGLRLPDASRNAPIISPSRG